MRSKTLGVQDSVEQALSNVGPAFTIWFQPIMNMGHGDTIFSHEALLRGPSGEGAAFVLSQIPRSQIIEFDAFCREWAVQLAQASGLPARLNLNIVPNAICDSQFGLDSTVSAAREIGFSEQRLVFEIVENERIADTKQVRDKLGALRDSKILIALDDVGAGYNGLNSLVELMPDIVKLDMALIRGIDASARRRCVVQGIVAMCKDLGSRLIAEGVETEKEANTLHALGIDLMQGFLFGGPCAGGSPVVFRYPLRRNESHRAIE
ncbi:EAL domain-containing protein (putative c-di-GMP-specific phosphodiesterase class I) [Bradyrhizobium sp. USDA 4523]